MPRPKDTRRCFILCAGIPWESVPGVEESGARWRYRPALVSDLEAGWELFRSLASAALSPLDAVGNTHGRPTFRPGLALRSFFLKFKFISLFLGGFGLAVKRSLRSFNRRKARFDVLSSLISPVQGGKLVTLNL